MVHADLCFPTNRMSRCLTDSELKSRLSVECDDSAAASHLDDCSRCQRKLAELEQNEQLFSELVAAVQASKTFQAIDQELIDSFQRELQGLGYQLLEMIHQGGQGTVYRARQLNTARFVAIKRLNIKSSVFEDQLLRFEREIEIISRFQHPGIVTIFDRGTAAGFPYFAMELVAGKTLDQFAATSGANSQVQNKQSIRDQLNLFREICAAVSYAHRSGVIHRDLKPGNILVDSQGHPKILDFGLAKLTELDSQRDLTKSGQFLGTLAYASPEQIHLKPRHITVASDVYSLGVILYELLTGRLPYSVDQGLSETIHQISNVDPVHPQLINRAIDRDIETILLKTLAKDPSRRHRSVEQLDRDVQLYLSGQPIESRRENQLYVWSKTVRQHWIPVCAGCLVFLITCLALIGSFGSWRTAVDQRDLARAAKDNESLAKNEAEYQSYLANIVAIKGAVLDDDIAEANRRLDSAQDGSDNWEWRHWKCRADESVRTLAQFDLYLRSLDWIPGDSPRLFCLSGDHHLAIVNELGNVTAERDLSGHVSECCSARTQPWIGLAQGNTIQILNAESLSPLYEAEFSGEVIDFDFLPKDSGLVAGVRTSNSDEARVVTFDLESGNRKTLVTSMAKLACVSVVVDSNQVFLAGQSLERVEIEQGIQKTISSAGPFHILEWNSSQTRLVTVAGRTWMVYDRIKNKWIGKRDTKQHIRHVAFTEDDESILVGGKHLDRYHLDSQAEASRRFVGNSQATTQIRPVSASDWFVTGSQDGTLRLWNPERRTNPTRFFAHSRAVRDLDISPDGDWLASAGEDQTIQVRRLESLQVEHILNFPAPAFAVRFSADGKQLAAAGDQGQIRTWNLNDWSETDFSGHTDRVHSVEFSPDGRFLLTASRDQTVRLWDCESGELIRVFEAHRECVHAAVFDPTGAWIASRSHFEILVWNRESGELKMSATQRIGPEDYSLEFHPQKFVVAAGTSIEGFGKGYTNLLDATSGEILQSLEQHYRPITGFDFGPRGRRAVSASMDSIKVWDPERGIDVLTLDGCDEGGVLCVRFGPQGSHIIAGLSDGSIIVWSAEPTPSGPIPLGNSKF